MPTSNQDQTPRFALPYIMPSQAQKHVTHNEAVRMLDVLIDPSAKSRTVSTPPSGAADGDCYIVGDAATDAWTGHEGEIAAADAGGWRFQAAAAGQHAYVEDEQLFVFHDGTEWREWSDSLSVLSLGKLAVNATPDPTARLLIQSDTAVFSYDSITPGTGDFRLVLNRADSTKTASAIFQTGYSGRAEIGLAGSDDLKIKTSPDGATWKTAVKIDTVATVLVPEKLMVGATSNSTSPATICVPVPVLTLRDSDSTGNSHLGYINWVDSTGTQKAWMGLGSTTNSEFLLTSQYSDGITLFSGSGCQIQLSQNGTARVKVHTNGNVGISEPSPTAPLHVAGAARVGTYTVATVPGASSVGAGSIIFVSNESGGATLAFSDGTNWRRVHDRAIVS